MSKPAPAAPEYPMIATEKVLDSPRNPRKHYDPAKLKDLEANVQGVGRILSPILIRPFPKKEGFHECLAGHRRMKVARRLKLATVPIVDLGAISDDLALEILLIENLHHEDVLPLEEAAGYEELLQLKGYTLELVAQKVSKPVGYISRMLKLLNLIEPLKKLFFAEEMTLAHAQVMCKLSAEDQQRTPLFDDRWQEHADKRIKVIKTVRELRAWIRSNILLSLSEAPWKKDDPLLVPRAGSCTACPKRTGSQVALWEDEGLTAGDDRCLDAKCYGEKKEAFIQVAVSRAKEKGGSLVKVASSYMDSNAASKNKDVVPSSEWEELGRKGVKTCANAEAGIIVYGERIGQQVQICRKRGCPVHRSWQNPNAKVPKGELPASETWKRKRDLLDARLKTEVRQAIFCELLIAGPKVYRRAELKTILGTMLKRALSDRLADVVSALRASDQAESFPEKLGGRYDDAIEKWANKLDDGGVARLIYALCFADGLSSNSFERHPDRELLAAATAAKVDIKGLTKAIRDPALELFEAKRTKALAAAKAAKPAKGKAAESAQGQVKGVCRYCACTMNTPCIGKDGEPCAWLKGSGQTVCTNAPCLAKNKKAEELARKGAAK